MKAYGFLQAIEDEAGLRKSPWGPGDRLTVAKGTCKPLPTWGAMASPEVSGAVWLAKGLATANSAMSESQLGSLQRGTPSDFLS